MALLGNQFYPCKLYKRFPNSIEADNVPILFYAELVSEKEKHYSQTIRGMITPGTRFVIRTDSSEIYEYINGNAVRGFIDFQGDVLHIQNISYDMSTQSGLAGGEFSKEHCERNAIKILALE